MFLDPFIPPATLYVDNFLREGKFGVNWKLIIVVLKKVGTFNELTNVFVEISQIIEITPIIKI